jgi:hypothetical protein
MHQENKSVKRNGCRGTKGLTSFSKKQDNVRSSKTEAARKHAA